MIKAIKKVASDDVKEPCIRNGQQGQDKYVDLDMEDALIAPTTMRLQHLPLGIQFVCRESRKIHLMRLYQIY